MDSNTNVKGYLTISLEKTRSNSLMLAEPHRSAESMRIALNNAPLLWIAE